MKKLSLTFILCLVWVGWAWAHLEVENLPDSVAIIHYRIVLDLTPDDLTTRNRLAMALCRTNKLEEAQRELGYILERDPLNFNALDGLGLVLIKMERCQEALEYLKKAVEINEQDVMVHVHLAIAYQEMKLPERAQYELKKARSLVKDPTQLQNIEKEIRLVTGH